MSSKKYNVILDLDNTILHSVDYDSYKSEEKSSIHPSFINSSPYFMGTDFVVFKRPYLDQFLDYLFANFNVSVWTAASKNYAMDIINNIILKPNKSRQLDYVFFSYHGNLSNNLYNKNKKDLRLLFDTFKIPNYNKFNTFIIDDYDHINTIQPYNSVLVPEFDVTVPNMHKDNLLSILPSKFNQVFLDNIGKKHLTSFVYLP